MSENVEKSNFGYEALWAKTENYVSKILVSHLKVPNKDQLD